MGVLGQSSNLRGEAGDGAMFLKGWRGLIAQCTLCQ